MVNERLLVNAARSHDVDEQADLLPGWRQQYQQLGCGQFLGTLAVSEIEHFSLVLESSNMALHESVQPPQDQVVFGMYLDADPGSTVNGTPLTEQSLLVLDGRRSHDLRTAGQLTLIGIAVSRDYLMARMTDYDFQIAADSMWLSVVQLDARPADMLRQYFIAIADILQNPGHDWRPALTPRMLANSAIANVALAVGMSNADVRGDPTPRLQQRRDRIVQLAIDYMRQNVHEEIGVLDICAATHVSRRTLQYCFEERLDISPLQYLKALRLNQARRQLKRLMESAVAREHENTIASVAALCGYNHASRFASEYKRLFGRLPSHSAAKA